MPIQSLPLVLLGQCASFLSHYEKAQSISAFRNWRFAVVSQEIQKAKANLSFFTHFFASCEPVSWAPIKTISRHRTFLTRCGNLGGLEDRIKKIKYLMTPLICNLKEEQLSLLQKRIPEGFEDVFAFTDQRKKALQLVRENGRNFKNLDEWLRDDKEVVLTALSAPEGGPSLLAHASARLRDNTRFMLPIVRENGGAFEFTSARLQDDEEMLITALRSSRHSNYPFPYASERLRGIVKYLSLAISRSNGGMFAFACPTLQENREVVLLMIRNFGPECLPFTSVAIQNDLEIANEVVQRWGIEALFFVSESLRDNIHFMLPLIRKYGQSALQFASERLQKNGKVQCCAIS